MLNQGPWTFNQYIRVVRKVIESDQVERVPLHQVDFWVQIHNLPIGFRSSKIVQDIGNYVGVFRDSDPNNFVGTWCNCLRVHVSMEVEKPLKRRIRIKKPNSDWIWVEFHYERLTLFCFICGCLGHTDHKCRKIYDFPNGNVPKPFGPWMKASTRRTQFYEGER